MDRSTSCGARALERWQADYCDFIHAKSGAISRIVPMLSPGAGVVTSRGLVRYVVTEFGVAYLHGKSIRERAKALIEVSHPEVSRRALRILRENQVAAAPGAADRIFEVNMSAQARGNILIDTEKCKGCGLCVESCPPKCLELLPELNAYGIHPAHYMGTQCTGCGICFYCCPSRANRSLPADAAQESVGSPRRRACGSSVKVTSPS